MAKSGFHPVRRPGAATAAAKRAGMSLTAWARKNYHAPGKTGKRARFVLISRKWRKGGRRATRK
jgi:hypothetical protein